MIKAVDLDVMKLRQSLVKNAVKHKGGFDFSEVELSYLEEETNSTREVVLELIENLK
jgi:hypothetical protein